MAELNVAETCPKCGYVRKQSDTAPSWQCPSCGIVYAKFGAELQGHAHNIPAHGSATEDVVIFYSRIRLIFWLAVDVALTAGAVWMLKEGGHEDRFALWAGFVFGCLGVPIFVWLLFSRKPALVIDQKGITNNTLVYSSDYIPWSAYASEEEIDVRSKGYVVARNVVIYVNDVRTTASTTASVTSARKGTVIQTFALPVNADEIQAHVDSFHRAYLMRSGGSAPAVL